MRSVAKPHLAFRRLSDLGFLIEGFLIHWLPEHVGSSGGTAARRPPSPRPGGVARPRGACGPPSAAASL
eukprot:6350637-Pyramimonas_sp.AAC.1